MTMKIQEIATYLKKGKFIVFVDDKVPAPVTIDYLEKNTIAVVESLEEGCGLCDRLHERERKGLGRSVTRYRITDGKGDYIASEDLEPEKVIKIVEALPMQPDEKESALKHIKGE